MIHLQVMQENVSQEKEVTLHWTSPEDKSDRKHGREEVASRPTIYSLQEWLSRIKYDITIAGPRYAVTLEAVHEEIGQIYPSARQEGCREG